MLPLGGYGIGLLAEGNTVVAANLGGTNAANDCVVPFGAILLQEQFAANDGSAALGTVLRLAVRGSFAATFHAAFTAHADTAAVVLGITKNTDAAGMTSSFVIGATGRIGICGPITILAATLLTAGFNAVAPFVVEDSEAAAVAAGGAAAGALIRAHATIAGDTHPTANTVAAGGIVNWVMHIERMGDLQGIVRP